jgi:hypothetical protein
VPCVSHEQGYRGEQGMLPDVLTRHGETNDDWTRHDVLLSGSAPMMRATLARLVELNVSSARIKFDAFSEQSDIYLGLKKMEREERPPVNRKVLASGDPLPERRPGSGRNQASKSSATSAEVGNDWQVRTNPSIFSSGSRA